MLKAKFNKTIVTSLSQFEGQAESWNSLWADSLAYEAVSRAEGIASWMRHFETSKVDQFQAILVHHCDELVGGFAFYVGSEKGFKVARLPVNDWANCGELLIKSSFDENQIIECIVESLLQSEISLLALQQINLNENRWQKLVEELERQGRPTHIGRLQQVGVIDIESDWGNYFASLSGNHRSAVRRSEKKIRKEGEIELLRIENPTDEELQKWMQKAFDIEHRSWKARSGTSILASDGMKDYYLEEARIANAAQALELWFLCLDDTPIAFEYCHSVKDVCLSYKIGYDESYKAFGPGRLLRKLQLEFLNSNPTESTRQLDTKGILCDAKAKWTTRTYQTGTVLASVGGVLPNQYVRSYSSAHALKRKLLSRDKHSSNQPVWGESTVPLRTNANLPDTTQQYDESAFDLGDALVEMDSTSNRKEQVDILQEDGDLQRDFHERVLLNTTKLQDDISEVTSDMTISCQVLHTREDFEKFKEHWEQFHVDPMNSFEWNFSWWKAYSSTGQLHLIKFERNGDGIGFAPLYIDRWFGLKRLRFLATGEACTDYADIICDPKHYDQCAYSLAEYIGEQDFDTVELECTRDDRLAVLMKQHLESVYRFDHRVAEPTWVLPLSGTWDEFKRNTKQSLRRKINKAERKLASSEFVFSSTSSGLDVSQAFETLKSLHTNRWLSMGEKGVFGDPQFEEFLKTAVLKFCACGVAEISVVTQNGNPIGSQLNFDSGRGFQLYQSGYCPNAMKAEPGHMLLMSMIKRGVNRGDECFDFLRGNEPYKAFWGAEAHSQYKLRMVSKRVLPTLIANVVTRIRSLLRPNGIGNTKS